MTKLLYCLFLLFLTSCVEVVAIGSVTTAVIVARDKSIVDTKKDVTIGARINTEFALNKLKGPKNSISVIVNEQRVLLTGITDNIESSNKASDLAWKVEGVREVINEIQIVKKKSKVKSFFNYTRDSFISTQIKTRLFFNKNVSLINFKTTTVNGAVYIIGIAKNNLEISQVTNLVARTKGTKKVVSHLILEGDIRRKS